MICPVCSKELPDRTAICPGCRADLSKWKPKKETAKAAPAVILQQKGHLAEDTDRRKKSQNRLPFPRIEGYLHGPLFEDIGDMACGAFFKNNIVGIKLSCREVVHRIVP